MFLYLFCNSADPDDIGSELFFQFPGELFLCEFLLPAQLSRCALSDQSPGSYAADSVLTLVFEPV